MFLVSQSAIANLYEVRSLEANGGFSTARRDTTLIAEILKEVAGAP